MLKLFCKFDLLMILEGGEESVGKGNVTVGVPARMPHGWDGFKWGRGDEEKDLEVTTEFEEAVPNGLIGVLIAHMHRTLVVEDSLNNRRGRASPKVRADAALLRARDGSRGFVGFDCAKRKLCWKFRGRQPVVVARSCICEVKRMLSSSSRFRTVDHRHFVPLDCNSSHSDCGDAATVEIELSDKWMREAGSGILPPGEEASCESCWRPWNSTEIAVLLYHRKPEAAADICGVQPVMALPKYEVFISHAGPDKLSLAEPLCHGLAFHKVQAFLDKEGLRIHQGTTPEKMVRAMREARVAVFVLSPEFAAREWPMKELRHFLKRDKECQAKGSVRPVMLPVFFRLTVHDCAQAEERIYGDNSEHQEVLRASGFFKTERQVECPTEAAVAAFKEL